MIESRINNRLINAVDCPMGCGKTSAAMNYINSAPSDERFIYASPYIEEGRRISEGCKEAKIINIEKSEKDKRKTTELVKQVSQGNSIACTHALLVWFNTETLNKISNNNYTLIIDEAYEVIRTVTKAEKKQLFFLLDHNLIAIDSTTGAVSFLNDFESNSCSCLGFEMVKLIRNGCVHLVNEKIFIWKFPVEVLNAFKKVIIMTYMLDAQPMYYYLKSNGYQINNLGVKHTEDGKFQFCAHEESDGFRYDVANLIHILEDKKLNSIGDKENSLSSGWYKRDKKAGGENLRQLGRNIRNVQRHKFNCSTKDFMWTCFDKDTYSEFISDKNISKCHVVSNARAENKYKDKHYLAYGVGMYVHPDSFNYFKTLGYTINKEKWALASMLQWIWRSAIRDGEEIYIYIPSKYMRTLLTDWIKEVENNKTRNNREEGVHIG